MKKIYTLAALLLAVLCSSPIRSDAQTHSGYFLDNYVYGYRLNPAIMSESSFFALGVGNVGVNAKSDLGLSSLLFKGPDGGLVTGLNQSVPASTFLAGIKDANKLSVDAGLNLLSLGIRNGRSMTNFEVNLRADVAAYLPGDAFRFLKCGSVDGGSYDLSALGANVNAIAEVALGHAFETSDGKFTFGMRAKFLAGLASADVYAAKANLTVNGSEVSADVVANGRLACSIAQFGTDADGNWNVQLNKNFADFRPSGFGGAVDLGVKWKPFELLSVTAGVSDLGLVSWKYNSLAEASGAYSFEGFNEVGSESDIQSELEQMQKELGQVLNLQPIEGSSSAASLLPFTVNAGARFSLPVPRFISVGALATYHHDRLAPWFDCRAGLTLSPFKWFSLSGNFGRASSGNVCGVATSITLLFLNLYVAADLYQGPLGVYPVNGLQIPVYGGVPYPVNSFNCKLNFGLTLQFGRSAKARTTELTLPAEIIQ